MAEAGDESGNEAERAPGVFFSYSRTDLATVRPVIALLEAHGFSVWWDSMIEAGSKYVERTEHALESARAVVVAWSVQSVGSHWVRDEAMSGRDSSRLVPISFDGSLPPLGFRQFQVLDFSRWNGDPHAEVAQELVRAVTVLHGRDAAAARAAPRLQPRLTRRKGLAWLGLGGAALALGGGGLGYWLMRGGARGNSLAVLPFVNDSNKAEEAYIAAGLASELRTLLARNPALRVMARSSSEAIARRGLDAVTAANTLGVAYIVEGAAALAGPNVRISSDLIDGGTGIGEWTRTFDRPLGDLLALQQRLAEEISAALSVEVAGDPARLRLGAPTVPAAYDAYLQGWDSFTTASDEAGSLAALRLFQTAARLDPAFAGARAGEAATYLNLGHGASSAADAAAYYDRAVAAARQAMELGPDLDEAHSVLAQTLFEAQLRIAEAAEPFARSLELGPGVAANQMRFAEYAGLTGDDAAALPAGENGIDLDPLNPLAFKTLALVHYAARRFEDCIARQREALALDPEVGGSHSWIAAALYQLDRLDEARAEAEAEPSPLLGGTMAAIAAHRAGDTAAADASLVQLLADYGDASAYQQVQIYAQRGAIEDAMRALRLAREVGDGGLAYLRMDPMLDPLRRRPDFIRLQAELGFR